MKIFFPLKISFTALLLLENVHAEFSGADLKNFYTIGPMINFSFGEKTEVSMALEYSLWSPPYGLDMAIEWDFNRNLPLLYSEIQFGPIFAGGGAGGIYDPDYGIGFQSTYWVNYYLGGYLRHRKFLKKNVKLNGGIYFKAIDSFE